MRATELIVPCIGIAGIAAINVVGQYSTTAAVIIFVVGVVAIIGSCWLHKIRLDRELKRNAEALGLTARRAAA